MEEKVLREVINRLLKEKGVEGTIAYISAGDYPKDIKNQAMDIINGKREFDVTMIEHGDISDSRRD